MCLAGDLVAPYSLAQEVADSSPFTVMANIFVTEFSEHLANIAAGLYGPFVSH